MRSFLYYTKQCHTYQLIDDADSNVVEPFHSIAAKFVSTNLHKDIHILRGVKWMFSRYKQKHSVIPSIKRFSVYVQTKL